MRKSQNSVVVAMSFPFHDEDADGEDEEGKDEREDGDDDQGRTVVVRGDESKSIVRRRCWEWHRHTPSSFDLNESCRRAWKALTWANGDVCVRIFCSQQGREVSYRVVNRERREKVTFVTDIFISRAAGRNMFQCVSV